MMPLPGRYVAITPDIIDGYGKYCTTKGHEYVLATHAVVIECDSFGADYDVLCEECCIADVAEAKRLHEERMANPTDTCEWCKAKNVYTVSRRDIEEGLYGAVYDVCRQCIENEMSSYHEEQHMDDDDRNMYDR